MNIVHRENADGGFFWRCGLFQTFLSSTAQAQTSNTLFNLSFSIMFESFFSNTEGVRWRHSLPCLHWLDTECVVHKDKKCPI